MRTIPVTIEIPLDAIADAVGIEVLRTLQREQHKRHQQRAVRPPLVTLKEASRRLSNALTSYETAKQSVGERGALDALLVAAGAVRTAHIALSNPL